MDELARRLAEADEEFKAARQRGDGGRAAAGKALTAAIFYLETIRPDVEPHTGPIHHLLSVLADLDDGREGDAMLRRPPSDRSRPPGSLRHGLLKQTVAATVKILTTAGLTQDAASARVYRRLQSFGWKGGKASAPKTFLSEMEGHDRSDPRAELYHAYLARWQERQTGTAEQWVKDILSEDLREMF